MVLIRLVKVKEEDGRTTVYEYDAEDIRTASVTGGVRTEYITDREAVYSQVLVKTSYGKNVFGVYNEERERITYTYGAGLINERRAGGEEYVYHYNHLGFAAAITDGNGEIVFRIVYGTYGELYDIRNAGGVSLLTAERAKGCTAAEVGYALGMEYFYNGQYGVSTGGKIDDVWRWIQKKLGKVITLKHKATSGVPLRSTPGKTTTILGRYEDDTQYIIKELGIGKNTDFSGNPGGFNLLNTPDELYEQLGPDGFWEKYNKPFLDAAISRGMRY